jgi:hypothetical protein
MKKKYIVEFTYNSGEKETVTFETDNIEWIIDQWCRNRSVTNTQILEESTISNKQMLFG